MQSIPLLSQRTLRAFITSYLQRFTLGTRISAGGLALLTLILCRLPLFSVLGFEFCFVLALTGSITAIYTSAYAVAQQRSSTDVAPLSRILLLWKRTATTSIGLLILPTVMITFNGLWIRNCDWGFGLQCLLLMPVLSVVLASGVGVCCGICAGTRRWILRLAPALFVLLTIVLAVIHFYRSPAVYSYNPLVGYFPGNLYDENIQLQGAFYWARLYHFALLGLAFGILSLCIDTQNLRLRRPTRPPVSSLAVIALLLATTTVLYVQSGRLRFSVDGKDMRDALPGRYETEHFIIHYPNDPAIAENIELIASDHEFRRAQLVRDFQIDPPGKITSFYFANPDQKHELMGARNVYMAKPWRHEIYLNHQGFPHQVLRHEIAHAIAGSFGDWLFAVSAGKVLGFPVFFNVGMIEGLAVAADWPDHFNKALTPHQSVKAMQQLGLSPSADRLFSTEFLAASSAQSYTIAGSYLRFLWDQYGIESLRNAYQTGGDFEAVYGKPQSVLTEEWQAFLAGVPLPDGAAQIVQERFRRPGIVSRPCPHAIARAKERLTEQVGLGNYREAVATARSVCRDVPNEPGYQLQLAAVLVLAKEQAEATAIYQRIVEDKQNISSSLRARALFSLVSLAMQDDETELARKYLEEILQLPIDDNNMRQARVMFQILNHQGPAGDPLRGIFWNKQDTDVDRILLVALCAEALAAEPHLGLTHYLIGRQMRGRGQPGATVRALTRALSDTTLLPLVQREAARLLAEAAFEARDYPKVTQAVRILLQPEQPEVTQLLGKDWLERVQWARAGHLQPNQ